MRTFKMLLLSLLLLFVSALVTGCWNYRELDQMAVVAGVAIDKGIHEKYSITVEIVEITTGKESQTKSQTITIEGKTIFDAVRHSISLIGRRIYWSHAKVVIISREIAEEGVVQVLDWFNRDAETRADIHILVSKGESAKEILAAKSPTEEVTSFVLDEIITNQRSLSNAPHIEIWKFTNILVSKGVGSIATAIDLRPENNQKLPHIMGTAVFKDDSLLGFIDGEQTKDMLFIQNQIKGGILVAEENNKEGISQVSLEIFNSKTKIKPVVNNGNIEFNVKIETNVAIDEIGGVANVIEDTGRKRLEESAEKSLKYRLENIIRKVQEEYGVDIFGFGAKLREEKPKAWNTVSDNWGDVFKTLKVNVEAKVHIKNSAMLSKPLEIGD
ncbi:MAG: Ger(x)C family spore germination protein [Clostridia bacterium]|nr:Ger(x)C family spore germination protein [Clostridia bacterium]